MASNDTASRSTDDFNQLKLLFTDPIKHDYEVIASAVSRNSLSLVNHDRDVVELS